VARVTFASIVTSVLGSTGGSTFKGTLAGPVLQVRPSRRPRRASLQRAQNMYLSILRREWLAMTGAQREVWSRYWRSLNIAPPRPYTRSFIHPFSLFLHINLPRRYFGLVTQTAPPTGLGTHAAFKPIITAVGYIMAVFNYAQDPLLTGQYNLFRLSQMRSPAWMTPPRHGLYYAYHTGPQSGTVYWTYPANLRVGTSVFISLQRISAAAMPSAKTTQRFIVSA